MIADESAARAWLHGLEVADDTALARLELLAKILTAENARQNLVSAASLDAIWQRHIADSAQLLQFVPRETSGRWLDLGSGAGFPGLVIAALRPEIDMLLVESRSLRADWLGRASAALGLKNVVVIDARLEDVPSREFSVISARAFAPLERLLNLSARFSTEATLWLLPKGRSAAQELASLHGWRHMFHVEPSLTDADAGVIVGHLLGQQGRKS